MKRQFLSLKRSTKLFGVVALSAAIAAGCSAAPAAGPADKTAQEQQTKTVKTAKITKQKIGDPVEQVGDIVSSVQLDVVTKGSGEVIEVLKKRGDKVEKGDILFRLDPTDTLLQKDLNAITLKGAQQGVSSAQKTSSNAIADMKDNIATSETGVSDAEKAYNKTRNEYDLGQATKSQLDAAEGALDKAKRALESLRRQLKTLQDTDALETAQRQLDSAEINSRTLERTIENMDVKAPVSGVLTDLTVVVGQSVTVGYRGGEVQQTDPVKIKSQLTEASANLVRGKTELIYYVPGVTEKASAKIAYLSDVINGQTKAYDLELEVPNPDGKLKPGAKAQVELTKDDEQVVTVVPTLSIVREGGDNFVYILNGDTVQKRKVELGRLNETNQEILSGVKENEILVTSGQHQLKDQDKVQVAN